MNALENMYRELTRPIGDRMVSLVETLIPEENITRAIERPCQGPPKESQE